MRFSASPTLIGTLGALVQQAVSGANALVVHPHGLPAGDDVTKAGLAFLAFASQGAVAAQNGHLQLKNPAASGIIVYVDKLSVINQAAGTTNFQFGRMDADATTDGGAGINKDVGGAAASAHIRKQTNAGVLITTNYRSLQCAAGTMIETSFVPPIRLSAGEGVALVDSTVNEAITGQYEFRELAA